MTHHAVPNRPCHNPHVIQPYEGSSCDFVTRALVVDSPLQKTELSDRKLVGINWLTLNCQQRQLLTTSSTNLQVNEFQE
jgi:hypothetical protein